MGKGLSLFRSCAFIEDSRISSNDKGAMSLVFSSSAALSHCDVRKNGSQPFMVGACGLTNQMWEYDEGDCVLFSKECIGDDRSMSEWLSKKAGKFRWIDDDLNDKGVASVTDLSGGDTLVRPAKSVENFVIAKSKPLPEVIGNGFSSHDTGDNLVPVSGLGDNQSAYIYSKGPNTDSVKIEESTSSPMDVVT